MQPNQFPGDFQNTFILKIPEDFHATSSSLCHATLILFTWGLPYIACNLKKKRLTCENYADNYQIVHEHQPDAGRFPAFQRAI